MIIAVAVIWVAIAVLVYGCDCDPTATRGDRLAYSALWPVFAVILAVLLSALIGGAAHACLKRSR